MGLMALCFCTFISAAAQTSLAGYFFTIDLNQVKDDRLKVTVVFPRQNNSEIIYALPKIVPGTYSISDFGRYVDDFEAFDQNGKKLPVKRLNDNQWKISNAASLAQASYWVEDTYDSEKPNNPMPMGGTNIAEGENYVINTFGFFGYLDKMRELPYCVEIIKPKDFYGTTSLQPVYTDEQKDIYWADSYFRLTDAPMMYALPDTARVQVNGADVLIGIFSPNKQVSARYLANNIKEMLLAQADYLGGTMPVDHYAFIIYFDDRNPMSYGALEHCKSSFYFLPEMPQEATLQMIWDIASHEFFHIVTPLNLHAQEIQYFNFDEPELSEHLWLYEGVTEYSAHHFQVREGLIDLPQFLKELQDKMSYMTTVYKDDLPFTLMSKEAATTYEAEYGNVYQKGAIIAMCLDIELLDWSDGKYRLMDLEKDLSKLYGPNKPFRDEALFDDIAHLTDKRIKDFLVNYVAGSSPLPLSDVLTKVGIDYIADGVNEEFSLGQVGIGYNPDTKRMMVSSVSQLNDFGKALGYQQGDEFVSVAGLKLDDPSVAMQIIEKIKGGMKEGQIVEVVVMRPQDTGGYKEVTLRANAIKVKKPVHHQMSLMANASVRQNMLRDRWISDEYEESLAHKAHTKSIALAAPDFKTIDAMITHLYRFISGELGTKRDWGFFRDFFTPDANIVIIENSSDGQKSHNITVADYISLHKENMETMSFSEKEMGRQVQQFRDMAQVISPYAADKGALGKEEGVNFMQLVFIENRWWISSLQWQAADPAHPIPAKYLHYNE